MWSFYDMRAYYGEVNQSFWIWKGSIMEVQSKAVITNNNSLISFAFRSVLKAWLSIKYLSEAAKPYYKIWSFLQVILSSNFVKMTYIIATIIKTLLKISIAYSTKNVWFNLRYLFCNTFPEVWYFVFASVLEEHGENNCSLYIRQITPQLQSAVS